MNNLPKGCFVVGNKLKSICSVCGKVVRVDGFFAGWHLCLTEDEIEEKAEGYKNANL